MMIDKYHKVTIFLIRRVVRRVSWRELVLGEGILSVDQRSIYGTFDNAK